MNKEIARFNMVEQQIRTWEVLDPNVLDVCESVKRECFVPAAFEQLAFSDIEIDLSFKQKMITPKICARAAQALGIKTTDHILEIGTGSGYMSALLSSLGSTVVSFEINETLANAARKNLRAANIQNCTVNTSDGLQSSHGMYDVIMLTGGISCRNPDLEKQLKIGGRMFCMIGESPSMQATLITRTAKNGWTTECLFETEITSLIGAENKKEFEF
jgi:protein-L-isoaspartate(D-aspartate) O-methyltransferase